MTGTLYCIGLGPGDPELLTIKALRQIQASPVIALPQARTGGPLTARQILLRAIEDSGAIRLEDKTVLTLHFPMTKDKEILHEAHAAGAAAIEQELRQGRDVALLTLGCPTIYATSIYVHRLVRQDGFPTAVIPGVPSFCAAAAVLQRPLCEQDEPLTIIPGGRADRKKLLSLPGNKVLMKMPSLSSVQQDLKELGLLKGTAMIERCGLAGERIYEHMEDAAETGYFAVALVQGEDDPA